MSAQGYHAVEVTADQAFYLADRLRAGSYPWRLAITSPYIDPAEMEAFNARCAEQLADSGVLDGQGRVHPAVADMVRAVCRAHQWLEWLTVIDADRILRGVLARTSSSGPSAVVALRYAHLVTFTAMQIDHSEGVVPIVTAGLEDQRPASFTEFAIPMDLGVRVDKRIAAGAEVSAVLADLDIPERAAEVMELALDGQRSFVEITAHDVVEGAPHSTDVSVSVINSAAGRILVSPGDEPRHGGDSTFGPGDSFAIAVALRDLTARLPSRSWFDESFDI